MLAAMGVAAWLDAPAVVVFVLASLVGISSSVYRPAHVALLPGLAPSLEALTAANVSTTTIEAFGTLVGPALAGVLLAVADEATVFFVTAGLYVVRARSSSRASEPIRRPWPRATARPPTLAATPSTGSARCATSRTHVCSSRCSPRRRSCAAR